MSPRLKAHFLFLMVIPSVILAIPGISAAAQSSSGQPAVPGIEETVGDQNKESAQFFKAKERLFNQDWDAARSGLEQYLREYPSGFLSDEALFWLAQCLNRLSREETDVDRMISLKVDAVHRLNELQEKYSHGLWAADGVALRTKLARELVLFGRPEFASLLNPVRDNMQEQMRVVAMVRAIAELTKEAAYPILLRLGRSDPSPQVRTRAHFLLAQDYRAIALPGLLAASKTDPDENVRREAAALIERVRMSLIPVRLKYYVFTSGLTTPSVDRPIEEKTLNAFTLPHGLSDQGAVQEVIRSMWKDGITNLAPVPGIPVEVRDYLGAPDESYFMFENFAFNILNPDLRKEPSRITGTVKAFDRLVKTSQIQKLSVDPEHDQLFAIRRADKAVFLLFQFETAPGIGAESLNPLRNSLSNVESYAKETMESNPVEIWNCSILTTRRFWPMEGAGASALSDFGIATAEIPGAGGKWILQGHILCDIKGRIFIGRQFTLTDPQGKIVASGARIEVPAASPQAYKTEGKSTAIIFAPELKNLAERMIFEAGKYRLFKVGPALADALAGEVMNYDRSASIRDSEPASGEFNRVFKFSIDRAKSGLKRLGDDYIGGINRHAVGGEEFGDLAASQNRKTSLQRYALAVKVEMLDGQTMKPMRSKVIEGYGVYNQRWPATLAAGTASPMTGGGAELEAKKLQKACDDAVAQVLKSFVKLLKDL